jgi:predicted solute-binding protein
MYVNRWTLDFGERGREALRVFLQAVHAAGGLDPGGIDITGSADDTLHAAVGDAS